MRALVLALGLAFAAAISSCNVESGSCPSHCSCSCTVNTCSPTKAPTKQPTPPPPTLTPTGSPTASPTATPTNPAGRCCFVDAGTNYCLMVDQDDCEGGGGRRVAPAPRDFLDYVKQKKGRRNVNVGSFDGVWDANKACNSNPCEGVPVTVGSSNFSVDVTHAGLGPNGGISLTPVASENDLPTGSQAKLPGEVILAFDVDRFEGATELDSDFLTVPNYIWAKIQSSDPEIEDPEAVRVIRWDEDDQEWKDIQEECAGRIMSVDFVLDTAPTPNVLWVPLCHTSSFVLTTADDGDDKDDKKGKTKKAKTPTATKDSKAKSGKKAKAGKKAAATGIAVGAAVGGAAVLALGAFGVYKCTSKKNKTQKKAAKGARASAAAPVVNLPTGAMTV